MDFTSCISALNWYSIYIWQIQNNRFDILQIYLLFFREYHPER